MTDKSVMILAAAGVGLFVVHEMMTQQAQAAAYRARIAARQNTTPADIFNDVYNVIFGNGSADAPVNSY